MTIERQFAMTRVVLGGLWLMLAGGCTAATSFADMGGMSLLSLMIGSICMAPGLWLTTDGLRELAGAKTAAKLILAIAVLTIVEGVFALIHDDIASESLGTIFYPLVFGLAPGAGYILWAALSLRRVKRERARSAPLSGVEGES